MVVYMAHLQNTSNLNCKLKFTNDEDLSGSSQIGCLVHLQNGIFDHVDICKSENQPLQMDKYTNVFCKRPKFTKNHL